MFALCSSAMSTVDKLPNRFPSNIYIAVTFVSHGVNSRFDFCNEILVRSSCAVDCGLTEILLRGPFKKLSVVEKCYRLSTGNVLSTLELVWFVRTRLYVQDHQPNILLCKPNRLLAVWFSQRLFARTFIRCFLLCRRYAKLPISNVGEHCRLVLLGLDSVSQQT